MNMLLVTLVNNGQLSSGNIITVGGQQQQQIHVAAGQQQQQLQVVRLSNGQTVALNGNSGKDKDR